MYFCVQACADMCMGMHIWKAVLLTVSVTVGKDFNYSCREFINPFGENYQFFNVFITYVIIKKIVTKMTYL